MRRDTGRAAPAHLLSTYPLGLQYFNTSLDLKTYKGALVRSGLVFGGFTPTSVRAPARHARGHSRPVSFNSGPRPCASRTVRPLVASRGRCCEEIFTLQSSRSSCCECD